MENVNEVPKSELQELSLLLENRTFVDYFNVFLSLPVFGQHVFYNYVESEFEFEPPIRQKRHLYLDRREILRWLCQYRLRAFKLSPLFAEYTLCSKLRDVDVPLPGLRETDTNGEDRRTFTKNLMGTATGMLLFRESLRGSCGEFVYRCWKDIETWRRIEDPVRRVFWKNSIKTKYISQTSSAEVPGNIKFLVYQGILNFNLIPEATVQQTIVDALLTDGAVQSVESDDAMLQLQTILLTAMTSYWVPRHLLHVIKTTPEETLVILKRPAPGDMEYLSQERRLRCRFMFPTIYEESNVSSPATAVFTSKSAGDLPDVVSPDTEEEDPETAVPDIEMTHLLSLWGGPAKEIQIDRSSPTSTSLSSSLTESGSHDDVSKRPRRSSTTSKVQHARSPVPIILTSYLGGKKRTLYGRFPKTTNRIIWSLASDALACFPFRLFLEKKEQNMDLHYLSFWTDVRTYLDTDESSVDCFGQPLRRQLSHRLVLSYLSNYGDSCKLFSETLKMSLFQAISNNNDVSLLCMAQDIVQESLWEPLKAYIQIERKTFLKQVRGLRYDLDINGRRQMRVQSNQSRQSKRNSFTGADHEDPLYFFNCATLEADTPSSGSASPCSASLPCLSAMSRPVTSYHVSLSQEQMCKAMELSVLCLEYGTSMMLPQTIPKPQDLVDILHSDYGSLHVSRVPAVKHDALHSLMFKPKINIEKIQVSRKVVLDEVDFNAIKKEPEKEEAIIAARHRNRLVIRRNGMVLDRPTKPKSFIEILTTQTHFEFFKRFMLVQKSGPPLYFWKAIEDLKDLSNAKTRQIRVTQILRKFFGKYAKFGAMLDCHEEIIRQIPNMEKVTPGILICAQAAVYRSMERKWYPMYLETYPPESESGDSPPTPAILTTNLTPLNMSPEMLEIVQRAKKKKRGNHKTLLQWRNLTKALVEFSHATSSKSETQLLDFFLRCEVEKEQAPPPAVNKEQNGLQQHEKNILMSNMVTNVQTRVVIRNRLVILNRLPQDLRFWIEVKKYQELVDSATQKGNMSEPDTEFLCDKARSVIAVYLSSDVPPKVQVNVPNDMASNIINGLASTGPTRGLFHDAVILLFPMLYHFYRKFTDEWMNGDIPDDYLEAFERAIRDKVSGSPHNDFDAPCYIEIAEDDIKFTTQAMLDEHFMKIHFSISEGLSYIFPQTRHPKSTTNTAGRRMTKHSLHGLSEEVSPRRESRGGATGERHGDGAGNKSGGDDGKRKQSPKEKKKPEKIKVKELEKKGSDAEASRPSLDKARRLSQLVEALNQEREEKIKEQNKKYSKIMSFEQVVAAAMNELSDSNSVFS